jgi:hypothetical protein
MMATSVLSDFTNMPIIPKFPEAEALFANKPAPEGMIGPAEYQPVINELRTAQTKAAFDVGQADIDLEKAKRQEEATKARTKLENLQTYSEEIKVMPEMKAYEQIADKAENLAFVPTKDTATDLAAMFSIINIVGMVIGKSNAQRAMSAMNGMLEGYQKGRADLYKREQIEFDKNLKALQTKLTTAKEKLSIAMEVKKTDKEKGDLMATMVLAETESQVLKAMAARQGLVKVQQAIDQTITDMDRFVTLKNNIQKDANQRADAAKARADAERIARLNREAANERARLDREQRQALADAKVGQPGKQGQNALTFASRVYGNIENATNDLVNLTNLPAVAESPIFAGMIGADRDTVLRNITAFAARKVTDADQRAFEQVSNSLDAALARLEAQGLANGSTRGAIASFSALKPRVGDDAINMAIYLARVKQEIETGIKVHAEMPGATPGQKQNNVKNVERINQTVPFNVEDTLNVLKANRKPLGKKMEQLLTQPQIVPNVSMEPQDRQSKYEMGQVIKKGNKTYRIIGLDDPNDPDIEEVK